MADQRPWRVRRDPAMPEHVHAAYKHAVKTVRRWKVTSRHWAPLDGLCMEMSVLMHKHLREHGHDAELRRYDHPHWGGHWTVATGGREWDPTIGHWGVDKPKDAPETAPYEVTEKSPHRRKPWSRDESVSMQHAYNTVSRAATRDNRESRDRLGTPEDRERYALPSRLTVNSFIGPGRVALGKKIRGIVDEVLSGTSIHEAASLLVESTTPGVTEPDLHEPGTRAVPSGHVRLYHYTDSDETLDKIAHEGIKLGAAKGHTYGEPNGVWASAEQPKPGKSFVEFHLHPDDQRWVVGNPKDWSHARGTPWTDADAREWEKRTSNVALAGDVHPHEIVAVHKSWHPHVRYAHNNPDLQKDWYAGEFDWMKGDRQYGKVHDYLSTAWPRKIEEAGTWQQGAKGLMKAAPDAEYILEPEELDNKWRRTKLPVADLIARPATAPSCCGRHLPHERRLKKIRAWVQRSHGGDVQKALRSRPILVAETPNGHDILDGYHRALVAHEAKHTHVPAVVVRSDVTRTW